MNILFRRLNSQIFAKLVTSFNFLIIFVISKMQKLIFKKCVHVKKMLGKNYGATSRLKLAYPKINSLRKPFSKKNDKQNDKKHFTFLRKQACEGSSTPILTHELHKHYTAFMIRFCRWKALLHKF